MKEKAEVKISVRNLVEFILRTGSLDSRFTGGTKLLSEGVRIHKKIQSGSKENYTAEVFLKHIIEFDEFNLLVDGRADGIIKQEDENFIIDEIKSTTASLDIIDKEFNKLHWAQAQCYAYIFAYDQKLEFITIRLTYCNIETEEMKYLTEQYSFDELKKFFYDLVEKYYVWAKLTYDWNILRNISIKNLKFPFEGYRSGQRELAVSVYRSIVDEKNLFVQAPTGIGKTISTIFPAVKAIGEEIVTKIFYLTAKTITRTAAEEAFVKMRNIGLKFKTVTLTAKEKICFEEKIACNPEQCQYANGHFDRVNDAIMDILVNEEELSRELIEKYSIKHKVCPFELSLDLTLWADAIICDYNYVFDPNVYLKRFFLDKGGDYVFLIDEAHNLVDRSREMFSTELYKKTFLKLKKALKDINPMVAKILGKINSFMLEMKKMCGEKKYYVSKEYKSEIYNLLKRLIAELDEYLKENVLENDNKEIHEELLQLYFDAINFIKISELYDERYVTYIEILEDDVKIKLFCLDPSYLLRESLKRGKAAVFFSATLMPISYYCNILGGGDEDNKLCLKSPFNTKNRCLAIVNSVSTKYNNRKNSYLKIVEYIKNIISAKVGNYFIFFPSYQYMNEVYNVLQSEKEKINIFIQTPSMKEDEKEEFLNLFKPNPTKTNLGFCVLGGMFSEGIDLKGDRLIGSIIVSVGLPQICLERNIVKDYFENKNNLGYEYSYMYPGMNKVLQAAGRVIRSEEDKGVIFLIDERFTSGAYLKLFPKEWFPYIRVNSTNVSKIINEFWNKE